MVMKKMNLERKVEINEKLTNSYKQKKSPTKASQQLGKMRESIEKEEKMRCEIANEK